LASGRRSERSALQTAQRRSSVTGPSSSRGGTSRAPARRPDRSRRHLPHARPTSRPAWIGLPFSSSRTWRLSRSSARASIAMVGARARGSGLARRYSIADSRSNVLASETLLERRDDARGRAERLGVARPCSRSRGEVSPTPAACAAVDWPKPRAPRPARISSPRLTGMSVDIAGNASCPVPRRAAVTLAVALTVTTCYTPVLWVALDARGVSPFLPTIVPSKFINHTSLIGG
jgi:hypothetical protein